MKIYLTAPRTRESWWTFDGILPVIGKKSLYPNLAIATIAGLTPRDHEVALTDENVAPLDFDSDADIVGVTGDIVHRTRILEIVDTFKQRGKFVVVGGGFASVYPQELRGRADVVFVGEAEATWPCFLRDYAAGCWRAEYVADEKPELHGVPAPRFDLLEVGAYQSMTVQYGRGCPFLCEYCDVIVTYGRKPRTKTASQLLAEVEALHGLGARNVFVVDDNFTGKRKSAREVLAALAAWQEARGYPIEFMTQATLDVADDPDLLALLRRANFTTLFVGIETPRRASLLEAHKRQNLRGDMLESVRRIQGAGIEIIAGMIVGFDHDDASIFDEQLRFMQEARIPTSMTGMLNAVPGTPLHRRLQDEGRLVADTTGDHFVFTNVVPAGMSPAQLYEGYKDLLGRLYDYDHFRERAMGFLLGRGERVRSHARVTSADLVVFARFLWSCVLRADPARAWMTLRMIAETALRRPRRLPQALSLALLHKHLQEHAQSIRPLLERRAEELQARPEDTDWSPVRGDRSAVA
jgi:radical SAM superfamily enzyme YgiQ (UPF0313 family)